MAKVCILTAGRGTRMGEFAHFVNKALLPIDYKAVISHIILKFPENTDFVIAVGHFAVQVKDYLRLAHPDTSIQFVLVENYSGVGSGPAHSLACCKSYLMEPFYFVSCDTLWNAEINYLESENWVGVKSVSEEESHAFCNFRLDNNTVIEIKDKETVPSDGFAAFSGLCFIKDHEIFWNGIEDQKFVNLELEPQVSLGLNALVRKSSVTSINIGWVDVGNYKDYKNELMKYENFDFSKKNEFLYLINGKVIKFFAEEEVVAGRIEKAGLNPSVFPLINGISNHFYSYNYVEGSTLYEKNSPETFSEFLIFMDEKVWLQSKSFDAERMGQICQSFYYVKTLDRINQYHLKYPDDEAKYVRGALMPPLSELLSIVPWERLYQGVPSFIHGDLQFDNIIVDRNGGFKLLDWRHNFGGEVNVGDLYYDLAKLSGGMLLNYDYIKLNILSYSETDGADGKRVNFDFATRFGCDEYKKMLEVYILDRGLDLSKVRILVALIYLNMSPLHHYPFDKMLFSLGKLLLLKELVFYKN